MQKDNPVHFTPPADGSIRRATLADASVIYQFICDLENQTLDSALFLAVFERNLANPQIHYLIAVQADEPVGFVSCHIQYLLHHTGKVGEIQELYVHPNWRKQRIGQQLLNAVAQIGTEEELVNLEVTTNQKRVDTLRFYERESFLCTHYKLVKSVSF